MDPQQTHAPEPMVPALRALYEPLAPYAYAPATWQAMFTGHMELRLACGPAHWVMVK